ncbi:helix-turn-helix domain-containing protein [Streptomyces sp. NPDC053048]|uniref:helix-turn-helix domain-containing protein n=1 Tax=Streptomyces sp. NPDC053048 TaxID=3365694 RepID=UPI0037D14798
MTPHATPAHTPKTFAAWLREQLLLRGYPERGGQRQFAADSGISPATVSRLLRADGVPALDTLSALSEALGVGLGDLLVRAGILTADDLADAAARPIHPASITPEQAARELGITSEPGIATFKRMVGGLRATEPSDRRASG